MILTPNPSADILKHDVPKLLPSHYIRRKLSDGEFAKSNVDAANFKRFKDSHFCASIMCGAHAL
jgi:hypothetical protein